VAARRRNNVVQATAAGLLLVVLIGCGGRPDETAPLLVFGRTGMGAGELSYPRAAVVAPDGNLYVVDKSARVQCFLPDGRPSHAWNMPAKDRGKPTGLGIGPDPEAPGGWKLYVADTHYSRVMLFDRAGRRLDEFGSEGDGPGQFRMVSDVAAGPDGSIYVAEFGGNDRVSRFTPQHEWLLSFGGPDAGEAMLQRPEALLVDRDGSLWVADSCNHRICHFGANGEFLGSFGSSGTGVGSLRFPYGLDQLSDGTLVVAEYGNNRVQRFTRGGESLGIWGRAGRREGELAYPWAAAVGPGDRVYVVDSGNNRVQVLEGLGKGTWQTGPSGAGDH